MTGRKGFTFSGEVPASKSMLNRLRVIQSHTNPGDYRIQGDSDARDVIHMKAGLEALRRGEIADCGEGGTVLRFLAFRASRLPGRHGLTGSPRLFSRPLGPLLAILEHLGVKARFSRPEAPSLVIESDGGWSCTEPVPVDRSRSSQFASGILLNAWNLPSPLTLEFTGTAVSQAYLDMTRVLVERSGLELGAVDSGLHIAAGQGVKPGTYRAEPDLSSSFSLAAAAVVAGRAEFLHFPGESLQPDRVFVDILRAMVVAVDHAGEVLTVERAERLRPVDWNLGDSPDLFPVLAVLAALAEGQSRLHGAPHLGHKESDRIQKTAELLQAMGRTFQHLDGGLLIEGEGLKVKGAPVTFDPDQDHRLAMAAGVARKAGFPIRVMDPGVVKKSFPGFWSCIGETP